MTKFGSFFRRRKADTLDAVSGRTVGDVIQRCPRCGLSLIGHEYRLVAATPLGAGEKGRFRSLLSAIQIHDWQKVSTFQGWLGRQPNAEVYGIRCPDHQMSLAIISAPFELEEPYTLMHTELIDEAAIFVAGLPDTDTWHRF